MWIGRSYGANEDYTLYEQKVESSCKDSGLPWQNKEAGTVWIPVPKYRELDSNLLSEEKRLLMSKVGEGSSVWKDSGFLSLSIAESSYRDAMNKTFSCSIIGTRTKILTTLRETIEKKVGAKKTEIIRKLDSENKRLELLSGTLGCNPSGSDESIPVSTKLINTATLQYCTYTTYLWYLQSQIEKNIHDFSRTEDELRKKDWLAANAPTVMTEKIQEADSSLKKVQEAELRAAWSLWRAVDSYKEMTGTYGVHLMLVILYDDYVRLRDNLAGYFDIVSQTFEKAKNAQSK